MCVTRSSSIRESASPVDPQEAIANLLRELTIFHQVLQLYGVDPPLVAQAFRQVLIAYFFFFVFTVAITNLFPFLVILFIRCFITSVRAPLTICCSGKKCAIGPKAFRSDTTFLIWSNGFGINTSTAKIRAPPSSIHFTPSFKRLSFCKPASQTMTLLTFAPCAPGWRVPRLSKFSTYTRRLTSWRSASQCRLSAKYKRNFRSGRIHNRNLSCWWTRRWLSLCVSRSVHRPSN